MNKVAKAEMNVTNKTECQVYDMAATTGRKGTHMVQNVCVVVSATTREEN